jgi:hypothetical protein
MNTPASLVDMRPAPDPVTELSPVSASIDPSHVGGPGGGVGRVVVGAAAVGVGGVADAGAAEGGKAPPPHEVSTITSAAAVTDTAARADSHMVDLREG